MRFPAFFAGGGITESRVQGASATDAACLQKTLVSPQDLAAAIDHALEIDPDFRIPNSENRPRQWRMADNPY